MPGGLCVSRSSSKKIFHWEEHCLIRSYARGQLLLSPLCENSGRPRGGGVPALCSMFSGNLAVLAVSLGIFLELYGRYHDATSQWILHWGITLCWCRQEGWHVTVHLHLSARRDSGEALADARHGSAFNVNFQAFECLQTPGPRSYLALREVPTHHALTCLNVMLLP